MYEFLIEGNRKYGTDKALLCQSVLNCDKSLIKETVIVAPWWEPNYFEDMEYKQIVEGSIKVWDCKLNGKELTYIKTGIGASVCTDAILALGTTQCKRIIFVGSVGALDEVIEIGDIVIPILSVCGDGVCRYLERDIRKDCFGEKYYPDKKMNQLLLEITSKICLENNIKYHEVHNFSVDTIFAQFAHLDDIIDMKCKSIEMETAALFKAAALCNIPAVALLSTSDNALRKKSLYSGRTDKEQEYRISIRKRIIPKIIFEIL